jgi:hypothetical protein
MHDGLRLDAQPTQHRQKRTGILGDSFQHRRTAHGNLHLYRPRFVRHRIEFYAATAASESWFCRTAAGV